MEELNKHIVAVSRDEVVAEKDIGIEQVEELQEEFYSFMYEKAMLVGPTGTSPSKMKLFGKNKAGSCSPTRGSLEKYKTQNALSGPSMPNVPVAAALSREIMDALLPPKYGQFLAIPTQPFIYVLIACYCRTWHDAQGKWQRMVRLQSASRTETQRLQETFDQLLEHYQARVHAICPVREKFFLQVFEELIREVACECPERGLLLLRLRDELRLTIEAYQTLYHNSIAYGRQKAVQAESGIGKLAKTVDRLTAERDLLESQKKELAHKIMS
ncbi:Dynein light chain [Phytophthora megakarya]|uniref:Dynein light chain n=1 Tax=Phytophthora megakarya TaxID=4795 RepID=A0A225V110_9STRA|nr:Dynein light chain [Phytophthora megakarya]